MTQQGDKLCCHRRYTLCHGCYKVPKATPKYCFNTVTLLKYVLRLKSLTEKTYSDQGFFFCFINIRVAFVQNQSR